MAAQKKHRTHLRGRPSIYHVVCEDCGDLYGIALTLADAKKREAQHRRDMKPATADRLNREDN
jgi:Fe2+ or Zn2+ uptake regulation protein